MPRSSLFWFFILITHSKVAFYLTLRTKVFSHLFLKSNSFLMFPEKAIIVQRKPLDRRTFESVDM